LGLSNRETVKHEGEIAIKYELQRAAGKLVSWGGSMASAGVCLGSHPLHGNLPPGDTLVRNPH